MNQSQSRSPLETNNPANPDTLVSQIVYPPGTALSQSPRFQLIYADPPWEYRDKANAGQRGACHKYDTMSLAEVTAMRDFIDRIAAPDCLLAVWWVPPQPKEALQVVDTWGFELKTMKGFTWRKLTKNGLEFFGMGNWTRANTEDCLFAVRGHPKRINRGIRQLISAEVREHSRKPDEARNRLVELMGEVPRIELFARMVFPGWAAWGNEVTRLANVR